jgi:hypothetical protein
VGGSNPSLLKKSACLFGASVALSLIANEPSMALNFLSNLTGGLMDTIHDFNAVIFASTKAASLMASSVLAGLAANGVTPHLCKRASFGAPFFLSVR